MSSESDYALFEPDGVPSSNDKPLVVLMGWVGAQRDGALLKYAQLLAAQGYASVRSVAPLPVLFSPLAGGRRRWALGLLRFLAEHGLWPQRRLVLYAFSNGGAFIVEQLMQLAESDQRYAALPASVAGLIWDSAPAFLRPRVTLKVLAEVEPPSLARSLRSAYYNAVERVQALTGTSRGASFWAAMQRLAWAPQLFLYSEDDHLCDATKVSELVEDKRRRGQDVRAHCWQRSEHVSHLRHHRQEYTQLLLAFLVEAAGSGGSGGAGSGGSASAGRALQPQVLRARL